MAARHVLGRLLEPIGNDGSRKMITQRHNPAYRFAYDVKKERCKIGDDLPVLQRSFFISLLLPQKIINKLLGSSAGKPSVLQFPGISL